MNIIDRIRILRTKLRSTYNMPMQHVYLGYEQMAELSATLPHGSVSYTQIDGMYVVPVIKQSHLAVGP